jgi:hypothetical protein
MIGKVCLAEGTDNAEDMREIGEWGLTTFWATRLRPFFSPLRSNANIVSWLLTDNVVTTQAYRLASIAGKWPVPPYRKTVRR